MAPLSAALDAPWGAAEFIVEGVVPHFHILPVRHDAVIDGVLQRQHPALLCAVSLAFWSMPTIGWPPVEGESVSAHVTCGAALHVLLPLSTTTLRVLAVLLLV